MPNPLLSVITVTYNAASTIVPTLESVDSQTFRLFEHIIIDGASSDDTLKILSEHPSVNRRVISEPDRGLYDAMNKGLRVAKGDYVVFLNSGDSFHDSETLEIVSEAMLDNDYPGIVYGQTDIVDASRRRIGERHLRAPEILTFDSFKQGMLVCHQAFFVLRKIAGDYNLKYKYSADYEWCLRCLRSSRRNCYVDRVIIDYLSEGMTTRHHRASLWERYRIMCDNYGTIPTTLRHIKFAFRSLSRR